MRAILRLWRIPLLYAAVLALPVQILVLWVVVNGYASYANFASLVNPFFAESPPPFDIEHWRFFARDVLAKDLSRMTTPHVPANDGLDIISLQIDGAKLALLNADLPKSGKIKAHSAILKIDGRQQVVKARYMGDNHWHWMFPQKSWRVKTKAGQPIRDRRSFNLKNPPPLGFIDEVIATRLTRELGNLTPDVEPVKFMINGTYGGLYLWWDVTDESLLRRARRMPGNLYRGDWGHTGPDGVSLLFRDTKYWEKTGARNAEQAENRADIDAFIVAVNGSPTDFHAFAEKHLDLDKFATFIAIDRVFGARHHDYNHNHKIYFDPYKGRFEPIQWDLGAWDHWTPGPSFDGCEYPILTRLKQHPAFELAIQERLAQIMDRLTPEELDRRIDALAAQVRPALKADGQRDARDWTAMRSLQFQIVPSRHFSLAEFDDDMEKRKLGYRTLHEHTLEQLAVSDVSYAYILGEVGTLTFAVTGRTAAEWRTLAVRCDSPVRLFRDSNQNGSHDDDDELVAAAEPIDGRLTLALHERLYPGLAQVENLTRIKKIYGVFDLVPAPLHYTYFLQADAGVAELEGVTLDKCVLGGAVEAQPVDALPAVADVYSWHPWRLPEPPATASVVLGPGVVEIRATRRYGKETSVTIAAGTTLRLAKDVSLHFFGKLTARGSEAAPILFEQLDAQQPWGVVSLHGQGTAGSRLAHCQWRGGSITDRDLMSRTGMMSVIDTHDIVLEHSFIGENFVGDDAMHWGYVTDSAIRDCEFEGAFSDALDIDICERFQIERCTFRRSGNDSVDLMTSIVTIKDCRFFDAGDKGVSVGEGSSLELVASEFLRCVIGIEIKDGSVARVDGKTTIDQCRIGINLYRKNLRYTDGGTLKADALHVHRSIEQAVQYDKRSTVPANLAALLRDQEQGE